MQKIVSHFDNVAKIGNDVGKDVLLPKELFNFLDVGTNPDLFTKQVLEGSVRESEICKGKIDALSDFHDVLEKEVISAFPELEKDLKRQSNEKEKEPVNKKQKN